MQGCESPAGALSSSILADVQTEAAADAIAAALRRIQRLEADTTGACPQFLLDKLRSYLCCAAVAASAFSSTECCVCLTGERTCVSPTCAVAREDQLASASKLNEEARSSPRFPRITVETLTQSRALPLRQPQQLICCTIHIPAGFGAQGSCRQPALCRHRGAHTPAHHLLLRRLTPAGISAQLVLAAITGPS